MARKSSATKRLEVWNTTRGAIIKAAVRHADGTFHGATNFPVKVTPVKGRPVA